MSQNRQLALYAVAMLLTAGSAGLTTYAGNGYQWKPALVTFGITFCVSGLVALARLGIILNATLNSPARADK